MDIKQMIDVTSKVIERVHGNQGVSNGTAPVELRIGYVNNICLGDGIVITDAPPAIIQIIFDWVEAENEKGGMPVSASAGFGGLLVH